MGYNKNMSGNCYSCGSVHYACHVCDEEGNCTDCTSGMVLQEGNCVAESIDDSISSIPFIVVISLLGLSIVLSAGYLIYLLTRKEEALYEGL